MLQVAGEVTDDSQGSDTIGPVTVEAQTREA